MKAISIVIVFFFSFIINIFFSIHNAEGAITEGSINYRDEMRNLVMLISSRAKNIRPDFIVVPQNAMDLITYDGKLDSKLAKTYFSSIDGAGCEELFYGHSKDGQRTSKDTTDYFLSYLRIIERSKKIILIIDYVINKKQAYDSFVHCQKYGFISFQANRSLTKIPEWIFNKNNSKISKISEVKNFLYLLNTSLFRSPEAYLNALSKAEHDLLVIDAFFWEKALSEKQVSLLQKKPSGRRRLVLAYLSIGEAEDYRFYWKPEWKRNKPVFLERENPEWKGNYKVKYWMEEWKEIICGRQDDTGFEDSYLRKIIDADFDGVYLDVLDAAYYFEKKNK